MKDYKCDSPVFSESIRIVEPSDPAHAENVNAAPQQLLQNTLANRDMIHDLLARLDSLQTLLYGYHYNRGEKKIVSLLPHSFRDGILTFPEGAAYADGSTIVLQGGLPEGFPPLPEGEGDPSGSVEEVAAAAAKIVQGNMQQITPEQAKDLFREN